MEASSDDEFHEARDEISSCSGSESPDEEPLDSRTHGSREKDGSESLQHQNASNWFTESRYSLWQDGPKTIQERRRLIYERFGIPDRTDHGTDGHVSSSSLPGDEKQERRQIRVTRFGIREHIASGGRGFGRGSNLTKSGASDGFENESGSNHLVHGDSKFEGESSRVFEDAQSSPLGQSGSDSTTQAFLEKSSPHLVPGIERLTQSSGAVLREGKRGPSSLKPPIGSRAIAVSKSVVAHEKMITGGTQNLTADRRGNQSNSPNAASAGAMKKRLDGTLLASGVPEGAVLDSGNGHLSQNSSGGIDDALLHMLGEKEPGLDRSSSADETNDILYKIKDLDSGKEFIIDELESKLRDLDTGKEISLEEFESSLGLSPVMQELRRRERENGNLDDDDPSLVQGPTVAGKKKKKSLWVRTMKGAAKVVGVTKSTRSSSDPSKLLNDGSRGGSGGEDGSMEKGRRLSGSHDPLEAPRVPKSAQRVKVHVVRKSRKEMTDLHMGQEIQAHVGAIWAMKFSLDGRYLASAGQDRVVHIREVIDHPFMKDYDGKDGTRELAGDKVDPGATTLEGSHGRRGGGLRVTGGTRRKPLTSNHSGKMPKLFWLSEKAVCSFKGHTDDVLDLSWSRQQQFLLSSSMDKTVRLWHTSYGECLRVFTHSDYVTCIDFSPTDDRYFLSGSLDDKVRLWSISDHQVVDWTDVREMVTAANFSPDGNRAVIGTYKGTCRFYKTTGHKLQLDGQIDVKNAQAKKGQGKKITGLQFMPGEPNKVLITSNDSRIRVYDGLEMRLKFKGLRNVNSQISATFNRSGEYIISASEDSRVYIWNSGLQDSRGSRKDKSQSYEHFSTSQVSIAIPWPGMGHQPELVATKSYSSEQDTPSSQHSGNDRARSPMRSSPSSSSSSRSNASSRSGSGRTSESVGECKSEQSSTYLARNGSGSEQRDMADEEVMSGRSEANGYIGLFDKPDTQITHNLWESPVGDYGMRPSANSPAQSISNDSPPLEQSSLRSPSPSVFADNITPKGSATWPEEKLPPFRDSKSQGGSWCASSPSQETLSTELSPEGNTAGDATTTAAVASWGLVIVTAGLEGEIRTFQNYGYPIRL